MPNAWYQRLYLVLAVVLGSIYILVPTFFWHPAEGGASAVAVEATPGATPPKMSAGTTGAATVAMTPPAVTGSSGVATTGEPMPGFMAFFPKKRLRLGLDLVGGSHLALGVDTDEALRAIAAGHRREVKERLTKEGIGFTAVNQPLGTSRLEIVLKSPSDREDLKSIMSKHIDERMEETAFTAQDSGAVATYGFKAIAVEQIADQAVTQVLELLRGRVNTFGVSEPIIFREKADRIVVELPGLKDPAEAIANIKRTARLEFRIVDEGYYQQHGGEANTQAQLQSLVNDAIAKIGPNADDTQINIAVVGKIPEDDLIFFKKKTDEKGHVTRVSPMLLRRDVALTGDKLEAGGAAPRNDQFGKWYVGMKFNAEGADLFATVTGENINKRMAVVLEGTIETDPVIQGKIEGGDAQITLGGSKDKQSQLKEASDISRVLNTGALPAPVRIEQNRTVGPSLGQDSIRKGIIASAWGIGLVFLFAWGWYRWSGFIATIALIANGIMLLGVMTLFDATLTLPGIAGVVLTIGMAVDANVLIYERIREELRSGKAIRAAVDLGFEKALSSIVDSNLTTAAAGVVLYFFGTDQIKGFAVTLLVGIATTLFTALVISKLMFDYWTLKMKPQELSI